MHQGELLINLDCPHRISHGVTMINTKIVLLSAILINQVCWLSVNARTNLPTDPQTSQCKISETKFKTWFAGHSIAANGKVNAADSVTFPTDNTDCDFYKWSSQMFLWLTSPAGNDGSYVFDSKVFFDVSPESDHKRKLISNVGIDGSAAPNNFGLRIPKKDEEIEEVGQAGGGGVLMSQDKSLVYYGIHVNDVYAYFLTGQKNNKINATNFPDSQTTIDAVKNYVKTLKGVKPLPDYNAMTMELKTSWVDVSTVESPDEYITITATVPKYVPSNAEILPEEWLLDGTQTVTLALVGMHVVGSVNQHPEMVWATFEHLNNAPDNAYYYTNNKGKTSSVSYSSAGDWLFMETGGSLASGNQEFMTVQPESGDSTGNIYATKNKKKGRYNNIEPSNTFRNNPWGSAPNDKSVAGNNAQLISLNNDILGFLKAGDKRKNYFLSGAVWTKKGHLPYYSTPKPSYPSFTEAGSLNLANSTMETYQQPTSPTGTNMISGCFSCHSISGAHAEQGKGLGLSHIYDEIQPLKVKKK